MRELHRAEQRRFVWAVIFAVMVAATAVVFDTPAEAMVAVPISPELKAFIEWCRSTATSTQYILAGCWIYV